MTPRSPVQAPAGFLEPLPLSALNDQLYCERRAHLKFVDGLRRANEHTIVGDLVHAAVDTPGYEHRAGWELLRALPLFSDRIRLSGKADLVEVRRDADTGRIVDARPVEYKKGPARRWINDQAQLCAQALCLEEMFDLHIASGLIYHAASTKRDEVMFDAALRALTLSTVAALRVTLARPTAPPALMKAQCDGCSLREVCLPEAGANWSSTLFEPRNYA